MAIGRPDNKTGQHEILAQLVTRADDPQQQMYKDSTVKVLGKSKKIEVGKRIRLTSDNYDIHVQAEHAADGTVLLFVAFTDTEFGVHHNVGNFFQDLISKVQVPRAEWNEKKSKLTKRFAPTLTSVHQKYNTSSILEANKKVDQVKGVMNENIQIALQNTERIEEMDAKSQEIEQSSKEFHSKAKAVKCRFIRQRIKLVALIAFVICVVITIIVLAVVLKK